MEKAKQNYTAEQIVLYGRSLGTGIATHLAANNKVKALVLETPYYNIEDIAKSKLPFLPIKYLLKYRFDNNKKIVKVQNQIYILHGSADKVVAFKSGQKLYELVKNKASFFKFENGTHSNLASFELYYQILAKIL